MEGMCVQQDCDLEPSVLMCPNRGDQRVTFVKSVGLEETSSLVLNLKVLSSVFSYADCKADKSLPIKRWYLLL